MFLVVSVVFCIVCVVPVCVDVCVCVIAILKSLSNHIYRLFDPLILCILYDSWFVDGDNFLLVL